MAPKTTKSLIIQKAQNITDPKNVYHDAVLVDKPIQSLKPNELLVRVSAVAFNRRDFWIRQGQYPGISFGETFGADAVGIVVESGTSSDTLLKKRVILTPMRGWDSHPDAPPDPSKFGVVGAVKVPPIGYFTEYVTIDRDEVVLAPEHLDDVSAAAWPLGGLTAWRACVVNGRVEKGQNVLLTGIGGGVALLALQICKAKGANVYVTSSTQERIDKAIKLGAVGGVIYKDDNWPNQLAKILEKSDRPFIDCVVDSAGANIAEKVSNVLKPGGSVVCFGMTALSNITFTMRQVLKNQRVIGSTMGSKKDFMDATAFIAEHKFVPVVSHVLDGLENAEQGFELLRKGESFGKVAIKLRDDQKANL